MKTADRRNISDMALSGASLLFLQVDVTEVNACVCAANAGGKKPVVLPSPLLHLIAEVARPGVQMNVLAAPRFNSSKDIVVPLEAVLPPGFYKT